MAESRDSAVVSDTVTGTASGQQSTLPESGTQRDEDPSGRTVEENTKTVGSEAADKEQTKLINGDIGATDPLSCHRHCPPFHSEVTKLKGMVHRNPVSL